MPRPPVLARPGSGLFRKQLDDALNYVEGVSGGSPTWDSVTGKPSTFPPSTHSHVISDVTGLQTALDGKQASGSYAAASHTHAISDTTGLQTALDGKQPIATVLTNTTASFTTAQETKLAGVATGSTANDTDANLRARANHTGTQAVATILAAATSRFFGRITGGSGAGEELTGTQATTLLDVFTSSLKGLAPASGGGTSNFLRADGTWAAPGGGSDPWVYLSLASNSTVSTTALADVSGMSFTGSANTTYEIEIFGAFQTAATTTGIGIALNIPSGTVYGMTFAPSANTTAMITQNLADDTVLAPTTAVAAANTDYAMFGKFLVEIGATGGAVQLRQRSEVAASNTVLKAGLRMKYRAI